MEVHKPKLIENWRELLKEWGIIVLGVLTALFAEQAVQSVEWGHKVDAALADMNNELSVGDGPQAYVRLAIARCISDRLDSVRAAVESGDRSRSHALIDDIWIPRRTWDYLAREAANASDVASHMNSGEMLHYRIAYEVIPNMNELSRRELSDLGHLRALPQTGGPLETSEKLAAIDAIEALRIDNEEMERESAFVLKQIKPIGIRVDRASLARNFGGMPADYHGCLTLPVPN